MWEDQIIFAHPVFLGKRAVAEQWISQEEWVASDGRLAKYRLILNPSTFKACIVLIYPLALFSDCCCYKEWKNNLVWCKQLHSNLPCWAACAFSALISVAVHLRWWEALDADWRSHGWRKWRWPGHRGKCAIKNQVKSCKMIEGNLSLMRLGYLIQFWFAMPVYQLKAEFFFFTCTPIRDNNMDTFLVVSLIACKTYGLAEKTFILFMLLKTLAYCRLCRSTALLQIFCALELYEILYLNFFTLMLDQHLFCV